MAKITYIALHNTGGIGNDRLATSHHLTASDIDRAHRDRWNMQSSLGHYGGYNFYIEKNGTLTQLRAIGEETMAQRGYNFNCVSICLAGNFLVEKPTKEQELRLKQLLLQLVTKDTRGIIVAEGVGLDISVANINPHRHYQTGTECNALPDTWGRSLLVEHIKQTIGLLASYVVALQQLIGLLKLKKELRLAGDDKSCDGFIS